MPSLNTGNAILSNAIAVNSTYNVGIGGAASGSHKLQVTGATNLTGKLTINTGGTDDQFQLVGTAPSYRMTNAVTGATINGFIAMAGATNNYIQGAESGDMCIGNQNNGKILFGFGAGTATLKMTIDSNGAATFSSTATATAFIPSGSTVPSNGMYLSAANTLNFATNTTNRLTITSAGNVGIGTSSPSDILDVQKNQNAITNFYFRNTDTTNTSSRAYLNLISGSTSFTIASINGGDNYIAGTSGKNLYFQQNIGGTVNMTISSSGNVGIGLTPTYVLDVANSSSPSIRVRNGALGGTATLLLETANNFSGTCQTYVKCIGSVGSGVSELSFGTSGASGDATATERMRILSSGGVQIKNIGSGIVGLSVQTPNSYSSVTYESQSLNTASTSWYHFVGQSGNGSSITTNNILIYGNGNVQNANNSYGQISDVKLKENIVDATPKLDKLMNVRIVNYNLINDPNLKQIGVVAQELEQIFPGLVDEHIDRDTEGNDLGTTTKSVKMSVFVPMLIKAMQEQQVQIEAQQQQINSLINR